MFEFLLKKSGAFTDAPQTRVARKKTAAGTRHVKTSKIKKNIAFYYKAGTPVFG